MKNYSADEEVTVFRFMFPFLPATSPSVNIEDQFVEKNEITKPRVPRKSKKLKRGKTVKYHCSCCDFQSPYRNSVKTHQDREHKKEKCRVLMIGCVKCKEKKEHNRCGNSNGRKRNQNKSEDEIFLCNSCDYKSRFRQNVKSHQKLNHKDGDEESRVLKIGCQKCEKNIFHNVVDQI